MALRIRVSPRATLQIQKAAEWWAQNRPAVPGAVRADIGEALALLAQEPGIGSPCKGTRVVGVRRLLLTRIRYFIYYRTTVESLDVLAVWHVSRGKQPSV